MSERIEWALLSYRIPREPSTPRIAVWRRLKRLGVAQLGDGLVALPLDARTREHFEWVADVVRDAGGDATIWLARTASAAGQRELVQGLADARTTEYRAVIDEAQRLVGQTIDARTVQRLRRQVRRISRRDYFPPQERHEAKAAVDALAATHATQAEATR